MCLSNRMMVHMGACWVIKVFEGLPNFVRVFREGLPDFDYELMRGLREGLIRGSFMRG